MRFLNVQRIFFCVSILLLIFGFQNCSRFAVLDNPPGSETAGDETLSLDEIFAKLADCPTDNWQSFCQSTQKTETDWHDYISFEPFDDNRAIIYNGFQTFIYNSTTQTLKQIQSDLRGRNHGQMGFPSLNRLALVIRDRKTDLNHLRIFDVNSGKSIFQSEPLSSKYNPCLFNPRDEKDGIILCSLPGPTANKPEEIQGALFNVKTLTMTKLTPIPNDYNWESNWPGGNANLYFYMRIYPFPHENKAIIEVRNSQNQDVLLQLTPESALPFNESTVYDYAGNGKAMAFADFIQDYIGYSEDQQGCPANLDQYPNYSKIALSAKTKVRGVCVGGKVWTTASSTTAQILECTDPTTCTPLDISWGADSLYDAGSNVDYLKGSGKLYTLPRIRSNGQMTLLSIDTKTKEMAQIPIPVASTESIVNYSSIARIEIPILRWFKNSYVAAYRFYVRDLKKMFDLPLIPDSGKMTFYFTAARILDDKAYVYGSAHIGRDIRTLIVQDDQSWLLLDESLLQMQESYNNQKNSEYLFLRNATQVIRYDILKSEKTVIGTSPVGYTPRRVAYANPYTAVEYVSNTSDTRRLVVYKNQQSIYSRDGKLSHLIPTQDNSGFWAIFENATSFSGCFGFKFTYAGEAATADVTISTTGLTESFVYTYPTLDEGEFLITQSGKIYNSSFTLVLAANVMALDPRQNQSIGPASPKFRFAYFTKFHQDPNTPGETQSSLYRFNFKTKQLETLSGPANKWYSSADDYLVTLTQKADGVAKGSVSYDGKLPVELIGLSSYSTTETYFHFTQTGPNRKITYSYISRSKLSNAISSAQQVNPTILPAPAEDAILATIVGDSVWWEIPGGVQGNTHIMTALPAEVP